MRTLLIILLVLVVGVGAAGIMAGPRLMETMSSFTPEPTGTRVRTATMAEGGLVEFVSAPGFLEPFTQVQIAAEVSARITELPVDEGDFVRKGEVIVRLDDEDLKAALDSSKARRDSEQYRLKSEQARLTGLIANERFAKNELERMQSLYETKDVSRRDLDDAEERVENAGASVEAAKFTISMLESSLSASNSDIVQSQENLDNTVIHAPRDGFITQLNVEVGEQVLGTFNNIGTHIMTIADLSRMLVKTEVSETDIASVAEGLDARIHINAYPDIVFGGKVEQVALQRTTSSSDGTGVFMVEVAINLDGHQLKSGHSASVDIEVEHHSGLSVESQAIVERLIEELPDDIRLNNTLIDHSKRTTSAVYRMVDGKTVCTPVIVGASDLTHTMIREGLSPGDVVVVGPYKVLERIKDGEDVVDEALLLEQQAAEEKAESEADTDTAADGEQPSSTEDAS